MSTIDSQPEQASDASLRRGITTRIVQISLTLLVQALVLFGAAGTLRWPAAWLLIGLQLGGIAVLASFLVRRSPEIIAERSKSSGMPVWDRWIGGLWAIMYYIVLLATAGLDMRWAWTGERLWVGGFWLGAAVYLVGAVLFGWAMVTNTYFTTVSRLQAERGQVVCDSGPYRWLRHPGYLGALLQGLAVPFLLGSLYALIPGALAGVLMTLRTAFEDRMLRAGLAGYEAYAGRVPYRLLPGIW